jgi:hypothetical protein
MKQIAIINYSSYEDRGVKFIKNNLNILKKRGFDTMLVSHHSVQTFDELDVDYYIYNSFYENFDNGPYFRKWYAASNFRVDLKLKYNFINTLKNLKISTNLANNLGYEDFIFLDSSVMLSDRDFGFIYNDLNLVKDKNMFFIKPTGNGYSFNFFAGKTEYFTKNFYIPDNEEKWGCRTNTYSDLETIEQILYRAFGKDENDFGIVNSSLDNYISNSEIGETLFYHNDVMLLANAIDRSQCAIFIRNNSSVDKIYRIIYGGQEKSIYLNPGKIHGEVKPLNSDLILVEINNVTENDEIDTYFEVFNTNTDYETLSKIGIFTALT